METIPNTDTTDTNLIEVGPRSSGGSISTHDATNLSPIQLIKHLAIYGPRDPANTASGTKVLGMTCYSTTGFTINFLPQQGINRDDEVKDAFVLNFDNNLDRYQCTWNPDRYLIDVSRMTGKPITTTMETPSTSDATDTVSTIPGLGPRFSDIPISSHDAINLSPIQLIKHLAIYGPRDPKRAAWGIRVTHSVYYYTTRGILIDFPTKDGVSQDCDVKDDFVLTFENDLDRYHCRWDAHQGVVKISRVTGKPITIVMDTLNDC